MKPWVVVPVFNEQATLGHVVAGARRWAPVLVVDDGSSDDTVLVASREGAEIIRHPRRLGKGQALRTGLAAARLRGASHAITLDGDGQHTPDDLPVLLAAATEEPDAIIVGGRLGSDPGAALSRGRLNAIRVAGFFVNWAVGLRLRDTQSGFRAYPLAVVERLPTRRGGFVFETEVLVAAAVRGVPVREVAVTAIPRTARRSRFRPIADGIAIGAYLASCSLGRWRREASAAGREVLALFDAGRLRARHRAMLETAACVGGSPPAWGAAVSAVAARRAGDRLARWWRHPRRRRAATAAGATLATPLLLAAAALTVLIGPRLPDLVTPLVRRLYSQDRLDTGLSASPDSRARRPQAASAVPGEIG